MQVKTVLGQKYTEANLFSYDTHRLWKRQNASSFSALMSASQTQCFTTSSAN